MNSWSIVIIDSTPQQGIGDIIISVIHRYYVLSNIDQQLFSIVWYNKFSGILATSIHN